MSGLTDMTLKILYTIVDGTSTSTNTSYLARSKKPQKVRVANIPNPNPLNINNQESNNGNNNSNNGINNNSNNNNNCSSNDESNKFSGINNNDCGVTLKVGAISLSTILNEIYINSPEVLENNNIKVDYNVYYKDICEMNEPLVSLGLLSKIRSKLSVTESQRKQKNIPMDGQTPETEFENSDREEEEDDDDEDDEDDMVVTGRVCSNFSALLRRSFSNSHKKNSKRNISTDTLEVKLKFSKIIQAKQPSQTKPTVPQISNTMMMDMNISPPSTTSASISTNFMPTAGNSSAQYAIPSLPTKITNNKIIKPKRLTNPMPAPRAKRTQSLPVWNMDPSNSSINCRKGKGSIAHKIFMADKLNEGSSPSSNSRTQVFTYEINTLQRDNTIQKHTVDDSISKRFDFMNNKPLGNSSSPLNGNPTSMNTTPTTIAATPNTNTATPATNTTAIAIANTRTTKDKRTKSVRKPRTKNTTNIKPTATKRRRQSTNTGTTPIATTTMTTPLNDLINQLDSNKENIPPLNDDIAPLAERMDTKPIDPIHTDQLDLNMLDFNDNAMNWFDDMTKGDTKMNNGNYNNHTTPTFLFENGNIKFNDIIIDPQATKNSSNNINNKETPKDAIVEDPDKTSPLDTLSMPLMELEEGSIDIKHHSNKGGNGVKKYVPTLKEQLKRLPILAPSQSSLSQHNNSSNNNIKKIEPLEDIAGSEATVLLSYNTSPANTLSNQNSSKIDLQKLKNHNNFQGIDEIDDEEKKQNRILPSSPSMIFEYRTNSYHDGEDETDSPDLFTTFINQNQDKNATNTNSQDDKFGSDFNEMRHSNEGAYTPATTVHFTSDEK